MLFLTVASFEFNPNMTIIRQKIYIINKKLVNNLHETYSFIFSIKILALNSVKLLPIQSPYQLNSIVVIRIIVYISVIYICLFYLLTILYVNHMPNMCY